MEPVTDDDLKNLFDETRRHFDTKTEETRQHFDTKTEETRRHFEAVAERIDARTDALAELINHVDDKLTRRIDAFEQRVDQKFVETQSMIKFSHAELDRRVRSLEDGLSSLQARVEKLEQSTH